jgi:DNA polymerase-3 subunit delta'
MLSNKGDMIWASVIGQERVKRILLSAMHTDRLPHAYLFYGNDGVGKDAMALEFARVLHCETGSEEACGACSSCLKMNTLQHPDVKLVVALPVGKGEKSDDGPLAKLSEAEVRTIQDQLKLKGENPYHRISIPKTNIIKINSIREVRRESSMSTFGKKKRVCIISHADEMGEEASNTILKTLEEPSGSTMLILTTAHRESLLPTIISRCQPVRFDPLTEEQICAALIERNAVDRQQAALVARLSNGSYTRALELLDEDFLSQRQDVVAFVRHVLGSSVLTLTKDIERIAAPRDRDAVLNFLTLLLMWFRDALVLSQGGEVINVDQREDLQRFVAKFPAADLVQVVNDVERAISLVNRNVYIMLVLLQLAVKLRSNILTSRQAELKEQ